MGSRLAILVLAGLGAWSCTPKPMAGEREPPAIEAEAPATGPRSEPGGPSWWLDEPEVGKGGFRGCADAVGATLGEARRTAVERGLAMLDEAFPDGRPEYRLTTWAAPARGGYRVAVLVETEAVRADAGPAKDGP